MSDKIILPDSPEAATQKTVTGWVSASGYFWGNDEHMARYDGSTHRACECGELVAKNSYCRPCALKREAEKFAAMQRKVWDGEAMLYSDAADEYFHDYDQISDHCEEADCSPDDLRLIICEPCYAREIDPNEYFRDDLPEDGEVDSELSAAFEELNKFIRESKPILSWCPGKFAAIVETGHDQ